MNFWNELKRAIPSLPPVSLWMLPSRIDREAPLDGRKASQSEARVTSVREIFLNGKRVRVR